MKMNSKEYFDKAASTWDEKFLTPSLSSFLEKLVPKFELKEGHNVLDVGTGTGVIIPYLAKEVGSEGVVTAIDYSEKMVQICKAKHCHLKNVIVKVANIEETTFPAQTFDAVICFGAFPHLENKQKALRNINRLLKVKGKLAIAHAFSSEELKSHHKKISAHVAHAMLPEKTEMIKLLEQTGFTKISIRDESGSYLCIAHKSKILKHR